MLEFKDVSLSGYQNKVLQPLSFRFTPGHLAVLVGPDAAACTACVRAALGLQPVNSGYVTLFGEWVTPLSGPFLREMAAYIPADCELPVLNLHAYLHAAAKLVRLTDGGKLQPVGLNALLDACTNRGFTQEMLAQSPKAATPALCRKLMLVVAETLHRQVVLIDAALPLDDWEWQVVYRMVDNGCLVVVATTLNEVQHRAAQRMVLPAWTQQIMNKEGGNNQ